MAKTGTKTRKRVRSRIDPVVTEIVRNGVIAVTEEMKTNLMRTAYNIIIYEALDFTTGLFTTKARRFRSASAADVHSRYGRNREGQNQALRPEQYAAGRHLRHQRFVSHRQSSQSRDADAAYLPQGRAGRLFLLHGALLDIGARSAASPPISSPKVCKSRS